MTTDPDKILEHQLSYVISSLEQSETEDPIFLKYFIKGNNTQLNKNNKFADSFLKFIAQKSGELLNLFNQNLSSLNRINILDNSKFLIIGKPGLGKTAFLNYLFSVWSNYMRSNKIMWIRVDLGLASSIIPEDLEILLHSKFTRIFCKHYLFKYDYFDTNFLGEFFKSSLTHLKDIFKTEDESKLAQISLSFNYILQQLHEELNNITKGSESKKEQYKIIKFFEKSGGAFNQYDKQLYQKLISYLIKYIQKIFHMKYIFIFDGLDKCNYKYITVWNLWDLAEPN